MAVLVIRALLKDILSVAHTFTAVLHHQVMSDAFFITCGYAAGVTLQGAKNFEVWRNYREEGWIATNKQNKAHTSLAVAGHRQSLRGSSARNNQESQRSQKYVTFPTGTLNTDLQGTQKWSRPTAYLAPFDWWCQVCIALKACQTNTQSVGKPYLVSWGKEDIGEGVRQSCGVASAEQHCLAEPSSLGGNSLVSKLQCLWNVLSTSWHSGQYRIFPTQVAAFCIPLHTSVNIASLCMGLPLSAGLPYFWALR